ncbi:MAG: molybdenum ABC transporter ATP-binding protein [Betaproteobacteria bacterium]
MTTSRLRLQVSKTLGTFRLVAEVDLPLHGLTAVFGASGAGKTSLIDLIAGRHRPDSGRIEVGPLPYFDSQRGIDVPVERRGLGYVFQDARLFPHLTVDGNLMFGQRRARGRDRVVEREAVIDLLGLAPLLTRRPHALSGGEKQRVAIGRALLAQPLLLLMDEPLSSLDQARKDEVLPYIERLRDVTRIPILYVSHSVDEVLRLATALIVMDHGAVVGAGPTAEVLSDPEIAGRAGLHEVGSLVFGFVTSHDSQYDLTRLECGGFELVAPRIDLPVGTAVRARIPARDVAIAVAAPHDLSVSNRLPGVVQGIRAANGPYAHVAVRLTPGTVIGARLTREAVDRLGLSVGRPVWCLVKSVALDPAALTLAHGKALAPADR